MLYDLRLILNLSEIWQGYDIYYSDQIQENFSVQHPMRPSMTFRNGRVKVCGDLTCQFVIMDISLSSYPMREDLVNFIPNLGLRVGLVAFLRVEEEVLTGHVRASGEVCNGCENG